MKGVKKIMSVFYLMNKDTPALRVELEAQRHICKEVQPINLEAGPIYLACQEHRVSSAFTEWMRLRAPLWEIASRRKEILQNYAVNLSDPYWLQPQGSDITWKDITPFRNDFTLKAVPSPNSCTDGRLPKHWAIIDDKRVLIKESSGPYYREAKNEVLASLLLDVLDVPHVTYTERRNLSYCEDFITEDSELVPAWQVLGACEKKEQENRFDFFRSCCDTLQIPVTEKELANMLLFDWLIFNEDRHFGNFGFIRSVSDGKFQRMAPLYDHGNSLWFDLPAADFHGIYRKCMPFAKIFERQSQFMRASDLDLGRLTDRVVAEIFRKVWGERIQEKAIAKMLYLVQRHISSVRKQMGR